MAENANVSGLDALDPAPRAVEVNGKAVQVRPLTIGKLPAFARAIRPIFGTLAEALNSGAIPAEAVVGLIDEHGESLVGALSLATGVSVEELNESTLDVLLLLVGEVVAVNRDFLSSRLTPAIKSAAADMLGTGPTA